MSASYNLIVIILTTLAISSCNAFWWSSPTTEEPPTIKQIPIGYFRTYTYQPLSFPPSYSSYLQMANQNPISSSSVYTNIPQNYIASASSSADVKPATHPPPPLPKSSTTSSPQPQYHSPAENSLHTSDSSDNEPSQYISPPEVQNLQQLTNPTKFYPSQQQPILKPHIRQGNTYSNYPDTRQWQYNQNTPLMAGQQIQFVPCMCPVVVTLEPGFGQKRSSQEGDEIEAENEEDLEKVETP